MSWRRADRLLFDQLAEQDGRIARSAAVGGIGSVTDHDRMAPVSQAFGNDFLRAVTFHFAYGLPQVPARVRKLCDGSRPAIVFGGSVQRHCPTQLLAIE